MIGEAAERVSEPIAGLIYVCALIAPPGRTALEIMGEETSADGPPLTDDGRSFFIPPEAAIPLFYHRCSPADAAAAAARLTPEALAPIATPASVTEQRWARIPRAYIETSDDRTASLAQQRLIHAAAPCDPVLTIDADHLPFFSATTRLADALVAIATGFAAKHALHKPA